jgi:hypothetical protein
MSFALWMVLAAILLPYLTVMPAKVTSRVDNHAPRRDMERLTGWQQRLDWAHRNHFETFPAFAAAVIIAQMRGAPQGWADLLAVSSSCSGWPIPAPMPPTGRACARTSGRSASSACSACSRWRLSPHTPPPCALRRLAVSRMRARAAKSVSGHTVERPAPAGGRRKATLRAG